MDANQLTNLYRSMLRIRMIEERIADLYPQQQMRCPIHLSIGQEAVAVGVCSTLGPRDLVLSAHRSHAHYLAKGGDLRAMLAEFFGRATGCTGGKGGSMHLTDPHAGFVAATPILGSTIPIAVGVAFGHALNADPRVVAVFFGDGATEEGVFHESLNFAKLKKLPVLFICENNRYSVYSPLEVRQPQDLAIHRIAQAYGLPAWSADGNDARQVSQISTQAVTAINAGQGPAFVEFATYRWREHCGPACDDNLGYRPTGELDSWKSRCPILKLESELLAAGSLAPQKIQTIKSAIQSEIDDAVNFAQSSPYPDQSHVLADVYEQATQNKVPAPV